jgi:hypothetical protein
MIPYSDKFKKAMLSPNKIFHVRIELYDNNLNFIKDITKYVTKNDVGSISADRSRSVRRSFSFSLNNSSGQFTWGKENLIWIDKKLKLFVGLQLSDGTVEFLPQGVFALTQPQDSHLLSGSIVTVEGHDLTYFLTEGNSPFVNEMVIAEGLNCGQAIKIIAQDAGVTNFLFDDITDTIPYELTYNMASDRWQAMTEIATLCKSEVFFDTNGFLRLRSVSDINDLMNESAVWKFYIGDGFYSGNVRKIDSEKTANHIRVIGGGSQTETIIYDLVVDETNPIWKDNPYSIQKIGRKLYFHNDGNADNLITDNDTAKYRAKYELMNRLSYVERVSLNTAPIYFLEPSDIIEVVDQSNNINGRYRIESLQIPLRPETMTIELSKEERLIEDWNFI